MNTELRYGNKTIEINSILFLTIQAFTKYCKDSFQKFLEKTIKTPTKTTFAQCNHEHSGHVVQFIK